MGRVVEHVRNSQPGARIAHVHTHGGTASATSVLVGSLAMHEVSPCILHVVAHLDEADEAVDELAAMGVDAARFPALEVLPGESNANPDLLSERLILVQQLLANVPPAVIVVPIPALMQAIPIPSHLDDLCIHLMVGDERGPGAILQWLEQAGFSRVDSIESPGEFAVRGGLIDIFPVGGGGPDSNIRKNTQTETEPGMINMPVRLDFFDMELETIAEIDIDTMASDRQVRDVRIVGAAVDSILSDDGTCGFWTILPGDSVVVLQELMEITEQSRGYYERAISSKGLAALPEILKALRQLRLVQSDISPPATTDPDLTYDLPFETLPAFAQETPDAIRELADLGRNGPVFVMCVNQGERDRFVELLYEIVPDATSIEPLVSYIHRGFIWKPGAGVDDPHIAIVPYHELLHRYHTRRRIRRLRAGRAMDTFLDLQPGDYVVHRDHGIAKYIGLQAMDLSRKPIPSATIPKTTAKGKKRKKKRIQPLQEYLTLEFAKRAKLHVPATKIDLVQKYVGGHGGKPPLSTLGGKKWSKQKEQVQDAVRDLAAEMLRLQAAREHMPGIRYPEDTLWQKQFEAEFPYDETEDQVSSIAEIKKDMVSERPMDRLLCGDVGFGKTEVAVRASFKVAEAGKQVAVLVPTTVLAEQHTRTFRQRFADYPFRIECLSRFQTGKQIKQTLEAMQQSKVDIVIGTHRLLSQDIKFADLGLVIIDEEQRFGVEHKQRLLQFRLTADVLTLSATPIPRTLHMSLLGLRDISSLTTPPPDRRAIVTEVIPYNEHRIKRAIQRELAREGQVYFLHNKVYDIQSVADNIKKLAPDARVIIGHGQMPDRELERVMYKFMNHKADILVSTTIIESGIDIANANTIIINDAHRMGLADLHQLRGRVGRYKHRAYCYLLLPGDKSISPIATKRLRAIEDYSMLGAGFKIAMRDLEIRGAGNLLGSEQSGHIAVVGYEMYCQLLENAVHDLRNDRPVQPVRTEIELSIHGSIPKAYIPSDSRRMDAYRRISQANSLEALKTIEHDLTTAYSAPPHTTDLLLQLTEIRIRAAILKIRSITRHEQDIIFKTDKPVAIFKAFETAAGSVRLVESQFANQPQEVYFRPPAEYHKTKTLLATLRKRLAI